MSTALRIALTAIVLVNLAFVHATEDASLSWLAPMYAATLASPWLARFSDRTAYRWAWNLAVMAIFAVLVRHTSVAGPRFLLEDGLRLAAVCQVHVLCTLGTRQKPDLLFFNSFLIAVVTAFLTQDALYSAVFLAYAPVLVAGLSLYCAGERGPGRPVVRNSLLHCATALGVTALVFLVWPRDFHRKGLVVEQFTLGPAAQTLDVGFTDTLELDRRGSLVNDASVVMRATLLAGRPSDVPNYWRGATQIDFDGRTWNSRGATKLGDARWRESGTRALVRETAPGVPAFDVQLLDTSAGRLFVPLDARMVALISREPDETPSPISDGTLRFMSRSAGRSVHEVRFRLELAHAGLELGGPTPAAWPAQLAPALRTTGSPPAAAELADRLCARLPSGVAQHVVVETLREHLASRTDYLPPGSADAASDAETFLRGEAGGHCEHFATALALLLRREGIPCRLVTGYMSDEWDAKSQTLTLRRRDAHAWVEVRDPDGGWYTVDPTPAIGRGAAKDATLSARVGAWFGRTWDAIVKFDDEARDAILLWASELPWRAGGFIRDHLGPAVAAVGLAVAAAALLRLRRARRIPAAVRDYARCLRSLRLEPLPGETPRALLARAASTGLSAASALRLEEATRLHEAERYARN